MLFSLFSSCVNQNTESKSKALLDILIYVDVLSWSVLSPSPSPTLVDCPLCIQYLHSYSRIHENCLLVAWGRPCHPLDTGNIFSVGETLHCLFIRSLKISSLSVYLFRMLANISAITLAGKGQLSFHLINVLWIWESFADAWPSRMVGKQNTKLFWTYVIQAVFYDKVVRALRIQIMQFSVHCPEMRRLWYCKSLQVKTGKN
jgi:hypothetical protein